MADGTTTRAAGLARRGRRRRPDARMLWRRRAMLLLCAVASLVALHYLWFRDSSLVAVRDVSVEGVTSSNAREIRAALDRAARDTTTLHVDLGRIQDAVRRYPTVESVSADPRFPNGLEIRVVERRSVAVVGSGASAVPVGGDGTVLRGLGRSDAHLPRISGRAPSGRALPPAQRDEAIVLGAAPGPLRQQIAAASSGPEGIKVELEAGIELVFGDPSRAAAKWAAASRVLADPSLRSVAYVDVRSPERPAAGGAVTGAE